MNKSTCCIQECEKKVFGHLLCQKHYLRMRSKGTTSLPKPLSAKCRISGCDKSRRGAKWCAMHVGRFKKFAQKKRCVIDGCSGKQVSFYLCQTHYQRLYSYGSTLERPWVQPKCRMPGCDSPSRKNRWCSMHNDRIDRNGSPFDKDQKWVLSERSDCMVCGAPTSEGSGFRRYCGQSCAVMFSRGDEPRTKDCIECGESIDLNAKGSHGRKKYRSASRCDACRRGVNLRAFVPKLAKAKGTDCGICSKPIDMQLKYPDPMSRSVDHIFPRSLGGKETIENLVLAHLRCNVNKNNRLDYVAS